MRDTARPRSGRSRATPDWGGDRTSLAMAAHLLPGTDQIVTATQHFAARCAKRLPLAIIPTPTAFPRMRFYRLWRDRTHHLPCHRWPRGLLAAPAETLCQRPAAGA